MKIEVGMMVMVVHADMPDHRFLIGQVGTVESSLGQLEQMLANAEWEVMLPGALGMVCQHCGRKHKKGVWYFNSHELRPLIDPDDEKDVDQVVELDEELVA